MSVHVAIYHIFTRSKEQEDEELVTPLATLDHFIKALVKES